MEQNAEVNQRSRRTPVNLPLLDFEVLSADVDAVGSMMEGMTIVPSAPSVVSFPNASTPAAVLPTSVPSFASRSGGPRGDMSVLSGFTAPAVLSGRSLYRGNMAGDGGMGRRGGNLAPTSPGVVQTGCLGGGWSMLRDHPRMTRVGKFKLFMMTQGDSFCRGFVGNTPGSICANKDCTIMAHSKVSSKWVQQDRVVFLLQGIKVARSITAFILPCAMLVGDDLPEELFRVASTASKTQKQWVETFFVEARLATAEYLRLEENDDEEEDSSTLDCQFGMEFDASDGMPAVPEFAPLSIITYPPFLHEEEVSQLEGDDGRYAAEMREAIKGVRERLMVAKESARDETELVLGHMEASMSWIVNNISILHRCGERLQEVVGDVTSITTQYTHTNLTDCVFELMGRVESFRFEELVEDVEAMDADFKRLVPNLRQGVAALGARVLGLERDGACVPLVAGLTTSSIIHDGDGSPVAVLGELIARMGSLERDNTLLRSDIRSQGGVSFGSHVFTSMGALEIVIRSELPGGLVGGLMCVELFPDPNILLCHNPSVEPGSASTSLSWEKATKEMSLKGYAPTARKVVHIFNEIVAPIYSDGKEAIAGQKIAAFKTEGNWTGVDGLDGLRQRGEAKIITARGAAITAIESKLPIGSKLRDLALEMVAKTYNWYIVLHRHLDAELLRLTQMHLETDALLVLLSEEVIIMFTLIHNIRKKGVEFSLSSDPVEYMVQCIWLTIEIHGVMDDMIRHGLSANGAINAAFVRFLTKQVAATASAKGVKGVDKSAEGLKKMNEEMGKLTKLVTEAKSSATSAQTMATQAREDVKNLFIKNKDLKR